jgi:hypothetical protein
LIPQGTGKYILIFPKASKRAAEIISETIRDEAATHACSVSIKLVNLDESTPGFGNTIDDYNFLIETVSHTFKK